MRTSREDDVAPVAKVVTIVGARPQLIKAAPVSAALKSHARVEEILVHTGQHYDGNMSAVFFEELGLPEPRHHLGVSGGGHGEMTGRMLGALEPLLLAEQPDVVIVYGDTNSTLAGALAAAKLHIPVAHVEAGVRSFNRAMPEEINRVVCDHVSSLLLCPTSTAVENLAAEGIHSEVALVGDVMYDAALAAAGRARERSHVLDRLDIQGPYAVATVHLAENTDDRDHLERVLTWLTARADEQTVVLPLHPRTRLAAERWGIGFQGLLICAPVGYLDMTRLVMGASAVYTDSGGLQKEAYFHRVPCVTLRAETEWTETIEAGWNRLWQVDGYQPRHDISEYGDGHAAARIADLIERAARPWRVASS